MSWIKDYLIIILIIGTLFGATLGRYPVAVPDGARYSEIPREMVATGDYLTPHLNGVKYFEKPPLFYWLQAFSIKVLGVNEFSVSIVNAIMALGCCMLIYLIGRQLYSRTSGLLASFIFATSALVFALTRVVTLDMTLTFFLTGSLGLFILATRFPLGIKRSWCCWMMYIFMALAVMTKGLVGVVIPGMILLIWTIAFNKWRDIKTYHLISGIFIFLLITLPWHILVQIKNHEFFHFYFIDEHFFRYLTNYAGRAQKWWFFPALLCGGLYPWITFLPQAIIHHLPQRWNEWQTYKSSLFLLIWAVTIYVFYSFSHSKLIPYLLPIFPALAILLGNYFADFWHEDHPLPITFGFSLLLIINLILGISAMVAIFNLNFAEHVITKNNLYIAGAGIIIGGIINLIFYLRRGVVLGFISLLIITAGLWLYISPIITTINRQSIKPLITILQQNLTAKDEVITYNNYYQDLPFYLQRRVIVANYAGELTFGMRHQDTRTWMINPKNFWQRWNSKKRIYLVTDLDSYLMLQTIAADKIRVVAKYLDVILAVNTKQ